MNEEICRVCNGSGEYYALKCVVSDETELAPCIGCNGTGLEAPTNSRMVVDAKRSLDLAVARLENHLAASKKRFGV